MIAGRSYDDPSHPGDALIPRAAYSMWRFLVTALLLVVVAVTWWWTVPPDPVATLRRHGATLGRLERSAAPELGDRVERWRLITAAGDTLGALWRAATPGAEPPWTIVLLGGLVAGDRAALLVPETVGSHLLALDWPWRGARRMPWWRIVLELGAIRRALLRSPGVLALGVEAAGRVPGVDPQRIALVGASLGVPPAVSALRLTERPAALALLHGGADLRALLRHALVREGVPGLLATPLAALAARLVHPLEPSLHAAACRRPVLILNSVADPMLPRVSVERLQQLFPAAEVRWRAPLHGVREQRSAAADATREVQAWLSSLP